MPDYLPNKPTVVGSRGQNPGSSYLKQSAGKDGGPTRLPGLSSSGGITANNLNKNKIASKLPNPPVYKYGGLGGGIGGGIGGAPTKNPYQVNY